MHHTQLQVLFEDKYLLALNKPQGIVVEKEPHLKITLEDLAMEYLRSKTKYPGKCFAGLAHRLDRPVSGVVIFGKKISVLKMLMQQFKERRLQKTYLAITNNAPPQKSDNLIHWHIKDAINRQALIYDEAKPDGNRAELNYRLLAESKGRYLLKVELITGRYHQIRAQLAHIGCPVVGDITYSSKTLYKENAICLHSYNLQLLHPVTGEMLSITAPPPVDEQWNLFEQHIQELK